MRVAVCEVVFSVLCGFVVWICVINFSYSDFCHVNFPDPYTRCARYAAAAATAEFVVADCEFVSGPLLSQFGRIGMYAH